MGGAELAVLTQLRKPTKLVSNVYSSGGGVTLTNAMTSNSAGAKQYLHTPVSIDTLVSVVSATGSSGVINVLSLEKRNTAAYSARIKVTVDGVVVFDATTTSASTARLHLCVAGHEYGSGSTPSRQPNNDPIYFNNSFNVEVSADATGTEYVAVYCNYQLR